MLRDAVRHFRSRRLTVVVMSELSPVGTINAALLDRVALGMPSTIDRLAKLIRIPSVSWPAFDPEHVRASAQQVRDLFAATDLFETVEIHEYELEDGSQGHPGIIAHRPAKPGYPTVMLYAHHDVQPPGQDDDWDTPAYEPTIIGERLYGRGASDDKAGVILHVAALEAIRDVFAAEGKDLGIGIAVFIEGEEEWGSESFPQFLENHGDTLGSDYIIVADSSNVSPTVPGLTVALRGNVSFNLTIRTLAHASHSGMFGGVAPDAFMAVTKLLATLWDESGAVAVPGLHVHDAEALETDAAEIVRDAGILGGECIGQGSVNSRIWYQPAITVTGIDAPDVANASNTLLPEVRVRISARVAPGADCQAEGEKILAHLRAHAPFGAELEVDDFSIGKPVLVDASADGVQRMLGAMNAAWPNPAELVGIGGSIPFIADLVERFPQAQVLVTGVEDPATRAHSPNESQHLGSLQYAIGAEALFLAELATGTN